MELAAEVADELVAHAGDDDRTVAEYCVAALEELGPPALSQLDSLARLAEAKNSEGGLLGGHAARPCRRADRRSCGDFRKRRCWRCRPGRSRACSLGLWAGWVPWRHPLGPI